MQCTIFSLVNLLLLIGLLSPLTTAQPKGDMNAILAVRQTTTTPQLTTTETRCLDYARIANLSTIGSNSTYRSAFTQASKVGTLYNLRMFTDAIAKLPPLMKDAQLNSVCGNFSEIAPVEAARNYTRGVVAQFSGLKGNPQAIQSAGPELIAIIFMVCVVLCGTWVFTP